MAGQLSSRLALLSYLAGWRLVRLMPESFAYALFQLIADYVWWRDGKGVQRLRANLARAVPGATADQVHELSRAGMRSYLRYWCESFRLPAWSHERIITSKRVVGREHLDDALAQGHGVVGFLGHLGNWDHAGAWSGLEYAKVTTVAERLKPEELFDAFVAYRERLGMEILPLTGRDAARDEGAKQESEHGEVGEERAGSTVFARLRGTLEGGGFVPLLSDRDLTARGVPVTLLGEPSRAAAGPAALALITGAPLLPITLHYERVGQGAAGWRSVFVIHPPVPVPTSGTGKQKRIAMTQACVDVLSAAIREHPQDWHMLQKVFEADLS